MSEQPETTNPPTPKPFYQALWFWVAMIGAVLIFGGTFILISQIGPTGLAADDDAPDVAAIGATAPNFTLNTLDGEPITLSDLRGQPVLVNFWATWCGPCRAEFPDFQEAHIALQDELVIVAVNNTRTDSVDEVTSFVDEFGITFTVVLDEEGETMDAYNVFGLPTSVFIDSEGKVNEIFTGPINKAYIESKLDEL